MSTLKGHPRRSGEELVEPARLRRFAGQVFEGLGMHTADADSLAEQLVWAELRGVASVGAKKIPQYTARLRAGGTRARAESVVLAEGDALVVIDAQDGWGQVAGARAMRLAIEKARSCGVGSALVRNTTSAGALGYFAMLAAEQRMVGLAINNSPPLQPVWGGMDKVIGNQAFAIASPAGRHDPLLFDAATSAISLARIHDHQRRGERLPQGVALTADGEPTVDPAAALAGILLPMAGHRGSGLSLMWEVLTGVLAGGSRFATDVTMPDVYDRPQAVSMFLLAIDPKVVMPVETFEARVDDLIDRVHGSAPAPGVERVTVPGERSRRTELSRTAKGIPLPAALVAELRALGEELGVSWE